MFAYIVNMGKAKEYTEEDLIRMLKDSAANSSLRQTATRLGVTVGYLSDVTRGNRSVSERLAQNMGFEREKVTRTIFRAIGGAK
jgi:transcriptional regulator with XRE-family HTH domain